ncbi:MAG: potassium/proton antiporter [Leptospiraceae bacterium]|nr:potassium/proton antiporter [Leptospiraceae bacterium]
MLLLFIASFLTILSIITSKLSYKFGFPALLFFLIIGMLAGSDGIGNIQFDDNKLAQEVGITALIFILFGGGLETEWDMVRPVVKEGFLLASFGVILTASTLGLFCFYILGMDWKSGLLIGAIISSTDAASVFNVLRTSKIGLKNNLKQILELESGSNDTIAVILTVGMISLIKNPSESFTSLFVFLILQLSVGAVAGLLWGKISLEFIDRIKLEYDGLYTVMVSSIVILIYTTTEFCKGNGFLAVYIAGIIIGNQDFPHKRSIIRFMDGITWIMQIAMFLTLGLLVFPSQLLGIALTGIGIAFFLIFVARPIGTFISLSITKLRWRDKAFLSWVGLRGASPIILATFPFTAGLENSEEIFNIVFFIVLISLLLQGTTIKKVAEILDLKRDPDRKSLYPFEFENRKNSKTQLKEFFVPFQSALIGNPIFSAHFPQTSLIVLICRGEQYLVPTGRTVLEAGDVLLVLTGAEEEKQIVEILSKLPET